MVIDLSLADFLNLNPLSPFCRIGTDSKISLFACDMQRKSNVSWNQEIRDDVPVGSLA